MLDELLDTALLSANRHLGISGVSSSTRLLSCSASVHSGSDDSDVGVVEGIMFLWGVVAVLGDRFITLSVSRVEGDGSLSLAGNCGRCA